MEEARQLWEILHNVSRTTRAKVIIGCMHRVALQVRFLRYPVRIFRALTDGRTITVAGFGVLKKCAAKYNMMKGKLDTSLGEAIVQAADEVRCARIHRCI